MIQDERMVMKEEIISDEIRKEKDLREGRIKGEDMGEEKEEVEYKEKKEKK